MTDWREELVEKMAREISRYNYDTPWQFFIAEARAALDVAEPVIREQCAGIAEKSLGTWGAANALYIADAIREGGKE